MFPEITRDEVFRIETRRLWLRWPLFADADDVAALVAHCSERSPVESFEPESLIRQWRSATAAGRGLHLLLVPKPSPRRAIGVVQISASGAGPVLSAFVKPEERGNGFGFEASRAVEHMARWLGVVGLGTKEHRPVEAAESGHDQPPTRHQIGGCRDAFVATP